MNEELETRHIYCGKESLVIPLYKTPTYTHTHACTHTPAAVMLRTTGLQDQLQICRINTLFLFIIEV